MADQLRARLEALIDAKAYSVVPENDFLEGVLAERTEWFEAIRALLTEARGADTILSHERPTKGKGSKEPIPRKER